jgi:hypothetical protein
VSHLPEEVDFFLNFDFPTLAVDVLQGVRSRLCAGAFVVTANTRTFRQGDETYRAFVADPRHGYRAVTVPQGARFRCAAKV